MVLHQEPNDNRKVDWEINTFKEGKKKIFQDFLENDDFKVHLAQIVSSARIPYDDVKRDFKDLYEEVRDICGDDDELCRADLKPAIYEGTKALFTFFKMPIEYTDWGVNT